MHIHHCSCLAPAVEISANSLTTHMKWPTCMITSRTRAGVKIRRRSVENVWKIYTPPDKRNCNLRSIVAVTTLFAQFDHSGTVYCLNEFLGATEAANLSASM